MLVLFQLKINGNNSQKCYSQVFIQKYPEILQSDNGREFANRILDAYLISINGRHILGLLYDPQSQIAIETFFK